MEANIFNYVDILKRENVNHIAEMDWTQSELLDFADFVRHMGMWYNMPEVERIYRQNVCRANLAYNQAISRATLDELEDPASDWLDDAFMSVKNAVADMAEELVKCRFFNELYR